jgi:hypothetical protein
MVTVKDVDRDAPYSAAVTVTVDCPPTGAVAAVTGNVAAEDEAEIVTEGATVRMGPSLETAMATPPAGAGLESVIVQVLVEPALRLVGLHDSVESNNGWRFKVAVVELFELPVFKLAEMVTLWVFLTLPAVAVNVADGASAGTDTDVGIVSSELLAVSFTLCASATSRFNLTVQVLELPEVNDVGLQVREDTVAMVTTSKKAVWEALFNAAVRVTDTLVVVVPAAAVKVTEVAPPGTVTVAGMVTTALLSDSVTMLPPEGAG